MLASFKVIKKTALVVKVLRSLTRIKTDTERDKSEPATGKSVIFKLKDANPF